MKNEKHQEATGLCTPPLLDFFVPGIPAPGGSKRAFAHKATGKIIVQDDGKRNKEWRAVVAFAARQAMAEYGEPLQCALLVQATFIRPRPSNHRGAKGLKPWAVNALPTVRPDATKLWRAAEDAMTGIVWKDDSQITTQAQAKRYGETPGMRVRVWRDPACWMAATETFSPILGSHASLSWI